MSGARHDTTLRNNTGNITRQRKCNKHTTYTLSPNDPFSQSRSHIIILPTVHTVASVKKKCYTRSIILLYPVSKVVIIFLYRPIPPLYHGLSYSSCYAENTQLNVGPTPLYYRIRDMLSICVYSKDDVISILKVSVHISHKNSVKCTLN